MAQLADAAGFKPRMMRVRIMGIIRYFELDGCKVFDVVEALKASGWKIEYKNILATSGLRLISRDDPQNKVTVRSIRLDRLFATYFVRFVEGGWLCLDHAIENYELDEGLTKKVGADG